MWKKKLKKDNNSDKSNSTINKSIFSNIESFDFVLGSGYENEFSDLQLSDSDSGDDNWNNEALDDTIKKFQMLSLTINNFFIYFFIEF